MISFLHPLNLQASAEFNAFPIYRQLRIKIRVKRRSVNFERFNLEKHNKKRRKRKIKDRKKKI